MGNKQMVWHAYHAGDLCQLVDLEARQQQIEEIKPEQELPARRRLMKPVIGKLPGEFIAACKAWEAACKAWDVVKWPGIGTTNEAWEARCATWRAREATHIKHLPEIEQLHAIECPDCPWDGTTIFPDEPSIDTQK